MPIKQAGKKALRHTKSRTDINMKVRQKVRAAIKAAREAIDAGKKKEAETAVAKAIKSLDRAYAKGTYKKNTVARTKSRLQAGLKKMGSKK